MTSDPTRGPTLARRSSGYSVFVDDSRVVFVIAPSHGFGVATLILGGLSFVLGINTLFITASGMVGAGVAIGAVALVLGTIAFLLHRAWKRRSSAGLDWPRRYVFDRRTRTLTDAGGALLAGPGELGARRVFRVGSRSVFVELVGARGRVPVYQVYTGGFSRGVEADALLAELATWGIPTVA